jgi:hypothetical protein
VRTFHEDFVLDGDGLKFTRSDPNECVAALVSRFPAHV